MIELADELRFSTNNGSAFEAYMFVTTEKFIQQHLSFKGMKIIIVDKGEVKEFSGEDTATADARRKVLSLYNKCLKESCGIDINKTARKLHMLLVYFGLDENTGGISPMAVLNDYDMLCSEIIAFAKSRNKTLTIATHLQQKSDMNSTQTDCPHLHIIYNSDTPKDELFDFLLMGK